MAALRWLGSRSDVLRDRIHLPGWSNGGTTVLNVLRRPTEPGPTGFWFRSAVAFYPGCDLLARAGYTPSAPLLIQAGEDDWTPAQRCVALKEASAGGSIEIDVYPGAHHGFDRLEGPTRYLPEVRNPNAPNGRGATVGPHPEARQRSRERALAFLREHDMQFHVEHRPAASGALP